MKCSLTQTDGRNAPKEAQWTKIEDSNENEKERVTDCEWRILVLKENLQMTLETQHAKLLNAGTEKRICKCE